MLTKEEIDRVVMDEENPLAKYLILPEILAYYEDHREPEYCKAAKEARQDYDRFVKDHN